MTHDPWSLHASLSCPACRVTGKVVQSEAEAYDEFDAPFVCCDCGQAWRDAGMMGDDSLKECRVNMMRLVEKRPYEPPKQDAAWLSEQQAKTGATMAALGEMLKQVYGPMVVKDIERRLTEAESLDLKRTRPAFRAMVAAKMEDDETVAAWNFQSVYDRQRSKVLPTGDIVTDLGGSIQISGSVAWGHDDMPWTSVLVDDSGGRTILVNYRTKQYHWNLATDEVAEK